jgi:hypothetical protein
MANGNLQFAGKDAALFRRSGLFEEIEGGLDAAIA